MNQIKYLFIIFFLFFLNSCTKDQKEVSIIKETNQELEISTAYKEAYKALEENDPYFAAKKFLEAELLLPQSDWAPKSALMAAYSYYIQDYYTEAIFNLERFINSYPKNERMDYAHYLLAMCFYEGIENEKKDLQPLISAKREFNYVISNYPDTDFSTDSKFKIDLINEVLAAKEMYLGRHYIKKQKWIPAINRFQHVIEEYDQTIFVEEAIHRLVEINYKLGLLEESQKYANLLGYNYLSSEWYKKSYKIFNKDYLITKRKSNKKRSKSNKKKSSKKTKKKSKKSR